MGNLSSLTLMLGANIKDFQTKMRKVSADVKKTGEQMKSLGKNMSMYVTAPIAAMGAASLAAFDKQAQAEAKLAAQIRQNGKDVQATMADYKNFASNLQNITTVGDETTLALMQMAESMGASNVKAVTQGAIGLSKALGVDLQSAIKMTTLAEQGNYTMLQRYVPALKTAGSESEKASIMSKLYADGLAIAQSEAQTGLGPLKQLQNSLGDLSESFGAIIADAIAPAVRWLKQIVDRFQSLSDQGKRTIAIVAGVAAAMGPLLVVVGTLGAALPAIAAGFSLLLGPIGLVAASIASIGASFIYVYGNWEAFKERMSDWSWWKNAIIQAAQWVVEYNPISVLLKGVNELINFLGGDPIPNPFEAMAEAMGTSKNETKEYTTEFKSFGATVTSVMGEAMTAMGMFKTQAGGAITQTGVAVDGMVPKLTTLNQRYGDLKTLLSDKLDPLPFNAEMWTAQIAKTNENIYAYEEAVITNWNTAQQNIGQAFKSSMTEMGVALGEALGDMVSGVDPNFGQAVLKVISSFLQQLGSALITYGVTMLAFTTLSSNPFTAAAAIAIGIMAVAAAKIITNINKGGVKGAKMESGGIVPPGFPNDTYPALLTSGEMVVPKPIPLSYAPADTGGSSVRISGSTRVTGKDLLIVYDKAVNDRLYTRG